MIFTEDKTAHYALLCEAPVKIYILILKYITIYGPIYSTVIY